MSNQVAEAKVSWRHLGDQITSSLIMSQKPLKIGKLVVCYGSAEKNDNHNNLPVHSQTLFSSPA